MPLRDLKDMMLLPKNEVLINKSFKVKGKKYHLMTMTDQTLWFCYESQNQEIRHDPTEETYRQILSRKHENHLLKIQSINIQNQTFTVKSSSVTYTNHHNMEGIMLLQHFAEKDCIPDFIYDLELNQIAFARYQQVQEEKSLIINTSAPLSMTLKLHSNHEKIMINRSFKLSFNHEPLAFNHTLGNDPSIECIIEGLESHDLWASLDEKFENKAYHHLTKDQLEFAKTQYLKSLESLCPKDKKFALVSYQCPKNISLNFYEKAYLDQVADLQSSGHAYLFKSDKKNKGYLIHRLCPIKAVDSEDDIDIELLFATITHPEETIEIKE